MNPSEKNQQRFMNASAIVIENSNLFQKQYNLRIRKCLFQNHLHQHNWKPETFK